jgi:hypothetical protein
VRHKVLLSTHEDVLALIDRRAAEFKISRSAYLVACALGLLAPVEPVREEKLPTTQGGVQ